MDKEPTEVPVEGQPPASQAAKAKAKPTVDRVDVQCNGMPGILLITTQAIVCKCPTCVTTAGPQGGRVMTPTEFERHSGMQASKKWRRSIKVDLGGTGRSSSISVGRWLEQNGFIIEDKDSKDPPRGGHASGAAAKGSSGHRHRPVESDYTDEEDQGQGRFHRGIPRYPLPGQHNLFPGMMPHPGMMLPPQGLNPFFMSPLPGMMGGGNPFHPAFGVRGGMAGDRKARHQRSEEEEDDQELTHRQVKSSRPRPLASCPQGDPMLGKRAEAPADQDLGKGPSKEQDELLTAAGALELLRAASETRGTASTGNKDAPRRPAGNKRGQDTDEEAGDDDGEEAGSGPKGSRGRQGGSHGSRKQQKGTPQFRGGHRHSSSELSDDMDAEAEEFSAGGRRGSGGVGQRGHGRGGHMRGGRIFPAASHLPYGYPSYPPGFGYDPYVAALAQQQQQQQLLAAVVAMGFPHPLAGGMRNGPHAGGQRLPSAASAVNTAVPRESKAAGSVPPETPKGVVGADGEGAPAGGKGEEEGNADEGEEEEEEDTPMPAHLSMSHSSNVNDSLDVAASSFAHQHGGFGLAGFASNPLHQALMAQQLFLHHQLMAARAGAQAGGPGAMMAAARDMLATSGRGFGGPVTSRGRGRGPAAAQKARHSKNTEEHSEDR